LRKTARAFSSIRRVCFTLPKTTLDYEETLIRRGFVFRIRLRRAVAVAAHRLRPEGAFGGERRGNPGGNRRSRKREAGRERFARQPFFFDRVRKQRST